MNTQSRKVKTAKSPSRDPPLLCSTCREGGKRVGAGDTAPTPRPSCPGLWTAWLVPRTGYMYTRVQGQRLSFMRDPRPVGPKLSEKELNCFPSSRTYYYSHSRGREGG